MYVCMHACMYGCMYVCMYVCIHACMYVWSTYVCMYHYLSLILGSMVLVIGHPYKTSTACKCLCLCYCQWLCLCVCVSMSLCLCCRPCLCLSNSLRAKRFPISSWYYSFTDFRIRIADNREQAKILIKSPATIPTVFHKIWRLLFLCRRTYFMEQFSWSCKTCIDVIRGLPGLTPQWIRFCYISLTMPFQLFQYRLLPISSVQSV